MFTDIQRSYTRGKLSPYSWMWDGYHFLYIWSDRIKRASSGKDKALIVYY